MPLHRSGWAVGGRRSGSVATLVTRVLLVAAFVTAGIAPLNAGTVVFNVGIASFDFGTPPGEGAPGTNIFNVLNLTGVNVLTPDFPIDSDVSLANPSIVVTYSGGGSVTLTDTDPWVFPDTDQIEQIEFLATFQTALPDGKSFWSGGLLWTPTSSSIDTLVVPSSGPYLAAGDLGIITITVPEPGTAATMTIGVLAVMAFFRFKRNPR